MHTGEDWTTTKKYAPIASCAEAARQFLRDATAGIAIDREAVLLLGSELVTNAIRHAQTPFTVGVSIRTDRLRVGVTDTNPQLPIVKPLDGERQGGLGLNIVNCLAEAWGVEPFSGGKTVWFETPIEHRQASGSPSDWQH